MTLTLDDDVRDGYRLTLEGRTVLVAGAGGGGMGSATAIAMADAGALVIAVDLTEERVGEVAAAIEERGGRCVPLADNLVAPGRADAVLEMVEREHGVVDGLVNVIGGNNKRSWVRLDEITDDVFDEMISVNLACMMRTTRAVASRLRQAGRRGSIVNFASGSGLRSAPYHGAYGAAKAGVISMTQTLALELGEHGIRVNAVAPGTVATPQTLAVAPTRSSRRDPLHGDTTPQDVAAAVLFLMSDLASRITGQTLSIDGGTSVGWAVGDHSGLVERARHARESM